MPCKDVMRASRVLGRYYPGTVINDDGDKGPLHASRDVLGQMSPGSWLACWDGIWFRDGAGWHHWSAKDMQGDKFDAVVNAKDKFDMDIAMIQVFDMVMTG